MKQAILFILLFPAIQVYSQTIPASSPFDATHWGVVLDHPAMEKVVVKRDISYLKNDSSDLRIDIYSLPGLKKDEKKPVIIFLNAIGEREGAPRVKSWAIYSSWPRLMAAHGYIGISMESDGNRIHKSFDALFKFLAEQGNQYNIDADRIGVYAASANTTQSGSYLMKEDIHPGIKAAVLYYGNMPPAPLRKNLPVLFVVAEGDLGRNNYQQVWNAVLTSKAPWTIRMASDLPHAFDAFSDNDEARIVVKETISFWKNHLDPVAQPAWKKSVEREIVETQYWNNPEKVVVMMKEWMRNNPDNQDPAAYRAYGNALLNTDKFAEAEPVYKKMAEPDPNNRFINRDLAVISLALNKQSEAEKYYALYMKDAQPVWNAVWNFAATLYRLKLYDQSATYYLKANAIQSSNGGDFYNAACCYSLVYDKEKAFEYLNKAIESGFASKQQYENDADLEALKKDERWPELIKKLK